MIKNIINQRFDNLIVIKDSGLRQNRKVVWTCQCDCGEIFNARSDNINSGRTKSCPKCAKQKNIQNLLTSINARCYDYQPGQKFGKLTLIEKLDIKNSNGCFYWKCLCDCGCFTQIDTGHIGKTLSCGSCLKSKGELKILQVLQDNQIKFEKEKTFSTCKMPDTNGTPRYDFYLPDYNLLIEFDGEQHYRANNNFWNTKEKVLRTQEIDQYKNQWALLNNIKLKRIPYSDLNKIDFNYIQDIIKNT